MTACSACGAPLGDDAKFCGQCGCSASPSKAGPVTPDFEAQPTSEVGPRGETPVDASSTVAADDAGSPASIAVAPRIRNVGEAARIAAMVAGVAAFGLWMFWPRPNGPFGGLLVAALGGAALAAALYGRHLGRLRSKRAEGTPREHLP